eukprot:618077-Rhodomonas_salina.1
MSAAWSSSRVARSPLRCTATRTRPPKCTRTSSSHCSRIDTGHTTSVPPSRCLRPSSPPPS